MGLFAKLLLGSGKLPPHVRAELEAEGVAVLEEGLSGSVRYQHFRAPGRRHHGKVTPVRLALAISDRRFAVYCRSGKGELIDSPFSDPRYSALELSTEGDEKLILGIDYDALDVPDVSGQVAIHVKTPEAAMIAAQLDARRSRPSSG